MRRIMIPSLRKSAMALVLLVVPFVSVAHAGEDDSGVVMGEFYVKDVGLPTAYVFTILPKPESVIAPTKLQSVLGDIAGEGGDAADALEVGFNKANLAMGVTSNIFAVTDGVGAMTGASFFDGLKFDLGSAFTYAGYLSVAVQAIVDIRSGDERRLAVNLYKNISNIGVNLVAAGNVALSVALAGVFAIDISLNWLGEESVNLRMDKGRQAYIAYMEDVRSDSAWRDFVYNRTESLAKEGRIDKLPGVLEDELRRLMEGFWTTSEADVILKAGGRRHSVMQRSERQRVTRDVEFHMKRKLAEMVEELEVRQFEQLWRAYVAQVEKQRDLLNTTFWLTVREELEKDEKPAMAGCRVRLGKLKSGVPASAWEFELAESGEGALEMTLLGYFQAGMPTKIEVLSPESEIDGVPPRTLAVHPFQIVARDTVVAVASAKEEYAGDWPSDFFGVVVPPPDSRDKGFKVTREPLLFNYGLDNITVEMVDATWEEYRAYCAKIAASPRFSSRKLTTFPPAAPPSTDDSEYFGFQFGADYKGLSTISVEFYAPDNMVLSVIEEYVEEE